MYALADRPALLHQPTLSKNNIEIFFKEIKKKSVKNTKNNRYTTCYMKNKKQQLSNHIFINISSCCTIALFII